MSKIEEVAKIIADNNAYLSNGKKYLLFVLGVPTQVRGNGNIAVVEFTDDMPHSRKLDWGDHVMNKLSLTQSRYSYGRYYMSTIIGDCDIRYNFGSLSIKFRNS